MSVWAIICEYDPFHNGHKKQIEEIKKQDKDAVIVAVMSGNFTQRGNAAILHKYTRAKCAVLGGCDLVLELPVEYAVSDAEHFAHGGVCIANALGFVDYLCFGSECGDIETLKTVFGRLCSRKFKKKISSSKRGNKAYGEFMKSAYFDVYHEELTYGSNDILALEYLHALYKIKSNIEPKTQKRCGGYNDTEICEYASATAVRRAVFENEAFGVAVPEFTEDEIEKAKEKGEIYSLCKASDAILSHIRLLNKNPTKNVSKSLFDRIRNASFISENYDELIERASCKCDSRSKCRRAVLELIFNFKGRGKIRSVLLLAASKKGTALLKNYCGKVKIITKPADIKRYKDKEISHIKNCFEADKLYTLCKDKKGDSGEFIKMSPYIEK